MWFFCKFCVGTGKVRHNNREKTCPECCGTGVVPQQIWIKQTRSAESAPRFVSGFGPASKDAVTLRFHAIGRPAFYLKRLSHFLFPQ